MLRVNLICGTVQDFDGDYHPLTTKELMTKTLEQLKETVQEQKERHRRSAIAAAAKETREERTVVIQPQHVHVLEGHANEVFICAWSPQENLLASG